MSNEPMESHGLRLPPNTWRAIEAQARASSVDRSTWLRRQIDWLLSIVPEVHNAHGTVTQQHADEDLFIPEEK